MVNTTRGGIALPGPKLLAVAALAAMALVAGTVAVVLDEIALAVLAVLVLQAVVLLAVIDTRRLVQRPTPPAVPTPAPLTSAELGRKLKARTARALVLSDRQGFHHLQEVEAMFQLFTRFQPRVALPSAGRWALDWSTLLRLVDFIERRPIRTIVELGSGTSTLWLAYALERRGTGGRIISLDHDAHYAQLTRESLAAHGFADGPADVRDAPLTPDVVPGHPTPWYDPRCIEDIRDIDLLVVDGPPTMTGPLARYPAMPLLLSRLSPGAVIVIDDSARPDETDMIERWLAEVPGLKRLDESGPSRQAILVVGA